MGYLLEKEFSSAVKILKNDPSQTEEILNLLLRLIEDDTILQIENIEQRIHEIANLNPVLSCEYVRKYVEKFKNDWARFEEPPLIHYFLPDNLSPIITTVGSLNHSNIPERMIKVQFFRALIKNCVNSDSNKLIEMQSIVMYLKEIADTTPFIKRNYFKQSKKDNFVSLVVISNILIDNIEERAYLEKMDFSLIERNLEKYPVLKGYLDEKEVSFLTKCIQEKQFTPFLHLLGEDNDRNRFYLNELEQGIQLYEKLPNGKNSTELKIKKEIKKQLKNEDLSSFLSELIIINRFGQKRIIIKDKKIGKKDIDLEIRLGDKKILLEITAPNMQIESVGFLKNKYGESIITKREQLLEGINQNELPFNIDNLFYYIVIDGSKTPIAYNLMEIFEVEIQGKDLVSGGIIFYIYKKKDPSHEFSLYGYIKNNPAGKNVLSNNELNELNMILFGQ